ncbi:hypothetical protein IGS68_10210 [Skermanella sp. TT6]|uniref:Uncharacterized protein n=1 Tax=Skermanella cutis TaxID=2775420 RepID=A0ABX7BE60_9PROT|nr:hypothetical protein [Skermanella sp. TT6]QQP91548.1 hypothetical protein IGS68_10210 [Skermanella sp. TT6]
MTTWVEQVEQRARVIHEEIAIWRMRAQELGFDFEPVYGRYARLLDQIYVNEMPLAKAKDNSELLLHVEGAAVETMPRISLVSSLFNNVKDQVRNLTKSIAGMLPEHRVTVADIDLELSGLARGSLYIGFNVPLPRERKRHANLLQQEDTLFKATQNALRVINDVSHTIEIMDPVDATRQVADVIDDPKIRDAALVAVRRIAPSGRTGVSAIGVTSAIEERRPAELTPALRQQIGKMLVQPVVSNEFIELQGTIREIDLDAKRFELRGIANHELQDIRCIYTRVEGVEPRRLLDARVSVRGFVERRKDESPRLVEVKSISFLSPLPPDPQKELF